MVEKEMAEETQDKVETEFVPEPVEEVAASPKKDYQNGNNRPPRKGRPVAKENKNFDWQKDWTLPRVIRGMAALGMGETEMAKALGITPQRFSYAQNENPHIEKAILDGRSKATKAIIAKTFQTAMGGAEIITVVEERGGKTGKLYRRNVTRTELPPNPKLLMFWLTNRAKEDWKDGDSPVSQNMFNGCVINPELAAADLERMKRIAGSLAESGIKYIESKVNESKFDESRQTDGDGTVQADSDQPKE